MESRGTVDLLILRQMGREREGHAACRLGLLIAAELGGGFLPKAGKEKCDTI